MDLDGSNCEHLPLRVLLPKPNVTAGAVHPCLTTYVTRVCEHPK